MQIFALYGTSSPVAGQFLIVMVPVLWLSKLRQLRLVLKIVQYLVLPIIPSLDFLMPLLPAPYQVIAVETARMSGDADSGPVLPEGKKNKRYAAAKGDDEEDGEGDEMDEDDGGDSLGAEDNVEADVEAEAEDELVDDADADDVDDDDDT